MSLSHAMYYLSVHLLFASIVASAAWALTSILRASATSKYWIWVATALNFIVPSGALIDKLWAPHLAWPVWWNERSGGSSDSCRAVRQASCGRSGRRDDAR